MAEHSLFSPRKETCDYSWAVAESHNLEADPCFQGYFYRSLLLCFRLVVWVGLTPTLICQW